MNLIGVASVSPQRLQYRAPTGGGENFVEAGASGALPTAAARLSASIHCLFRVLRMVWGRRAAVKLAAFFCLMCVTRGMRPCRTRTEAKGHMPMPTLPDSTLVFAGSSAGADATGANDGVVAPGGCASGGAGAGSNNDAAGAASACAADGVVDSHVSSHPDAASSRKSATASSVLILPCPCPVLRASISGEWYAATRPSSNRTKHIRLAESHDWYA